jgi:hypothetical protein
MESYVINSQIQDIKGNLARFIITQSVAETEAVSFSRPVFHMDPVMPERVFSIYGIKNGSLLFDTPITGTEELPLESLPVETVIRIKEQIEYHYKSKEYSRD